MNRLGVYPLTLKMVLFNSSYTGKGIHLHIDVRFYAKHQLD